MSYLLKNEVIDPKQFGFMPGRSTSDAIYGLVQSIYEARNVGQMAVIVFLDLRKAFDTVDHLLLLRVLGNIGCDDHSLSWFKAYLTGRCQTTRANGELSGSRVIGCGVPQGSVLGPLLFIIYINSIVDMLTHCDYFMYADDLAIVVRGTDAKIMTQLVQDDLNGICDWCNTFKLTINCDKTKVLWCYSERSIPDLTDCKLTLGNDTLNVVKEFNYLGVIIDTHLKFAKQCNKVTSSARQKLYHLRKLRKVMDKKLSILLYKSMILPVMDYGDCVVDGGPVGPVKSIQTIQNDCLRACLRIRDPTLISRADLHILCDCKQLLVRRNKHLLGIMYSLSQSPHNVIVPVRVLRGNSKVKLKVHRSNGGLFDKSPLYRGQILWNKLDGTHQMSASKKLFMNKVDS